MPRPPAGPDPHASRRRRGASAPSALPILALAVAGTAAAQESRSGWTVGIGIPYEGSTYIEHESDLPVFPILSWDRGRFAVSPFGVDVELYDSEKRAAGNPDASSDGGDGGDDGDDDGPEWSLAVSGGLQLGFGDRDEDESPAFRDMETRREETTLGLGADVGTPFGGVAAGFRRDVSGASDGLVAELVWTGPLFFRGDFIALLNVGVEHFDERHTDYFYGVRPGEATAERAAYSPGSATSPWVGYTMMYPVTPRWRLLHTLRVLDLDDAIVDSSLTTDDEREVQAVVISTWSF